MALFLHPQSSQVLNVIQMSTIMLTSFIPHMILHFPYLYYGTTILMGDMFFFLMDLKRYSLP